MEEVSATDLARDWESIPDLRRRGYGLQLVSRLVFPKVPFATEVQFVDKIGRAAVVENEHILRLTLTHLGTRVTVPTLEFHIKSFYELLHVNPGGLL